jgi:Xaa-Pro aminopeptidase
MNFRRLKKTRAALKSRRSVAMRKPTGACRTVRFDFLALILLSMLTLVAAPLAAREREPNNVYAERRARLVAELKGPVLLFGYTGRENSSPAYVFLQEANFYYLTGHNEEGAALLLVPESAAEKGWKGPNEVLFLPPRNPEEEKWNGPRMAPSDADVQKKTGFPTVEVFSNLKTRLSELTQSYHEIWTLTAHTDDTGYPHAREWSAWITEAAPRMSLRDAAPAIGAMRQVKSSGEIALLTRAIELSVDAQLAAMRMVRPGLYEYQVAARMVEIHAYGGCETEAYSPIVGTGLDSTILHFNQLDGLIQDGDVVLMDVGGQYSGYTADITRTVPANGHFTPRQREIYEIVLGAQNAALAAIKPGATMRKGSGSLYKIAYDYINMHGADREGRSLGRYFTHGLGHHIGLEVHDAGDVDRPFEAGMVITDEPGIYIPEEKIGVRIEDDVLVTPTGFKLLTARLPRSADEIEKIMAEAKVARDEKSTER